MRTPPGEWNASKIVTSLPLPTSSLAAVSPAGPDPTIATFRPTGVGCATGSASGWTIAQSAT